MAGGGRSWGDEGRRGVGLGFRWAGLVPIDDDVFGRAAGGDDVGATVAIEVGDFQVLAGHLVVVDHSGEFPGGVGGDAGGVKLEAEFIAGFARAAGADDDLVTAEAEEIAGSEAVALVEGLVEDEARGREVGGGGATVDREGVAVHGLDGGDPSDAAG